MRTKCLLLTLALIALSIGQSNAKDEQLNIFTWAGYVSDDIRTGFEEEFGVDVIVDTYASNEDLLAKLQAGCHRLRCHYAVRLHGINPDQVGPVGGIRPGCHPEFSKRQPAVFGQILRCREPLFRAVYVRHRGYRL